MIARIDHLVLTVRSLDATCAFYQRVLGFRRVDAPGQPTALLFGGQKINTVLSQSAKDVLPGWSYLPFQVYANSIFPDTAGQAYTKNVSLSTGLMAWQKASATYGTQQGFSVTSK